MDVVVEVPSFVAKELVESGLASRTQPSRGAGDVIPIALSVISLSADTVALVLARQHLKNAWARAIAALRREPKAQILTVTLGSFISVTLDLDELPDGVSRRDQIAPTVEALLDLIDVATKGA